MSASEAATFGWVAVLPVVRFVMFMAVVLLGFALLKEMSR